MKDKIYVFIEGQNRIKSYKKDSKKLIWNTFNKSNQIVEVKYRKRLIYCYYHEKYEDCLKLALAQIDSEIENEEHEIKQMYKYILELYEKRSKIKYSYKGSKS